uniref:C2H2-type domain-containing protein n=1 Tax=Biomphalaria glabrata TaxID=6526 RepID=A0A182Z9S0_BIOGL
VESLSNDSSVSCPECGKFVRKDTLVEHLRLHTGERPYICRFCSKGFAGRLTLRRHISSHLNMPMFMCDTCGREFKRNSHLIKHIRQHVSEKKGEKHTCDVSNLEICFSSLKQAYKIHCSGRGHQLKLKEHAGETKMHKCPVCDKRFLQESCCLLHLETVHRHPSSEADLQRIIKGHDLVTQLYGDHVKQVGIGIITVLYPKKNLVCQETAFNYQNKTNI